MIYTEHKGIMCTISQSDCISIKDNGQNMSIILYKTKSAPSCGADWVNPTLWISHISDPLDMTPADCPVPLELLWITPRHNPH